MTFFSFSIGLILGVVGTSAYFNYKMDIDGLLSQVQVIELLIFILLFIFVFSAVSMWTLKSSINSPNFLEIKRELAMTQGMNHSIHPGLRRYAANS